MAVTVSGEVEIPRKEHLDTYSITQDYLEITYCPWCGLHLNNAVDFDKSDHLGQYSSKEGLEK